MTSEKRQRRTKRKGKLLEDISAWLHDEPGVRVQSRVRLLTADGRKREIDVLLSRDVAGYPVRIAIECKNQRKPVGSPTVDSFVGKLKDLGIPVSHGILVSVSGYTKQAIKRASRASLRTLELQGLSKDGLRSLVSECLRSVVYLMASVEKIEVITPIKDFEPAHASTLFYTPDGRYRGSVLDLIWRYWTRGDLSQDLGSRTFELRVPSGWVQISGGSVLPPIEVKVTLKVLAFVISFEGKFADFQLLQAGTGERIRRKIEAVFGDVSEHRPLEVFEAEQELREYLAGTRLHIATRVRLPRIVALHGSYWPPRPATLAKIEELVASGQTIPDFIELEGSDLSAAWEGFT